MKKILFITHETSRTGAPILLLNFLKWLNLNNKDIETTLLSIEKGDLSFELESVVHNLHELSEIVENDKKKKTTLSRRIRNKLFPNLKPKSSEVKLIEKLSKTKWDLIFSNTIVNGKYIEKLRAKGTPIISYMHELEYIIKEFMKFGNVEGTLKYSNYFLCGSSLVQNNLIKNHQIKPEQSEVVHSFVDFKSRDKNIKTSDKIRDELEIPSDAAIVAMMGSFVWRKGTDYFVDTARKLNEENIYFLWIGADLDSINKFEFDLKKSKTNLKVILIPPSKEYKKYFNCIDLFYLSSREDPYPMVMVEATSYGIPIICFENAGGTQEFIDSKVGFVVPYGNTTIAAEKIKSINNERSFLTDNSEYIKKKSLEFHNVEINALQIFEVMKKIAVK